MATHIQLLEKEAAVGTAGLKALKVHEGQESQAMVEIKAEGDRKPS